MLQTGLSDPGLQEEDPVRSRKRKTQGQGDSVHRAARWGRRGLLQGAGNRKTPICPAAAQARPRGCFSNLNKDPFPLGDENLKV